MSEVNNSPFIYLRGENITQPFDTKPIEGYEVPRNLETNKSLPYCCKRHTAIYEKAQEWFNDFPNCCKSHKALKDKSWFKKEDYKNLPTNLLNKITYTEYHIFKKIDTSDWFKDITDYIKWTIESFGGQRIGAGQYINEIFHYVKNIKNVPFNFPDEKRNELVSFFKEYAKPNEEKKKNTDLNLLWDIYKRWLKAFPFEISMFVEIKEKIEKQLPFFYDAKYNPYSCMTTFKIRTKDELITFLCDLTKLLILKIDLKKLIVEGYIEDFDKEIFELELKNNELKTVEIFEQFESGEVEYRKAIKQWLDIQKDTFQLFKSSKIKIPKSLPSPSPTEIENKTSKASNFEKLFYEGDYPKVIHFLQKKNFIKVDKEDQSIQWIDDNEGDFIGFFWALFRLTSKEDKQFLLTPLPSNSKYQKLVFQAFQTTGWKTEKFVKVSRHSISVKASIASLTDELINHLFPS